MERETERREERLGGRKRHNQVDLASANARQAMTSKEKKKRAEKKLPSYQLFLEMVPRG